MSKYKQWFGMVGCGLAFFVASGRAGLAADRQLSGHVPAVVARFHLQPIGQLAPTRQLHLAIGLSLSHPAELDDFLRQLYDPASPNYRQYLTPEQFAERFGPTEPDYLAVMNFAKANGLTVTAAHDNRLLLDVSGPAANVEKAFQVRLLIYQHPTENRTFFAPDTDPVVNAALPVADVQGLSDFSRPHPKLVWRSVSKVTSRNGSAPDGSGAYFGNDFRNAYATGTPLTGAGQSVGLFQADGYYTNDITTYAAAAGNGRTNIVIQKVLIDGFNGIPTTGANSGNGEVSLDIEMAMAMAPGLSRIVLFEGNPNNYIPNDILNTMAASNTIKNLSCSWGWSGGPSTTTDNIFKQMAAQGQSFFSASGDSDAFTAGAASVNGVDNPSIANAPSSSTNIIQVGGTTLTMAGTGAAYVSETVWNWGGGVGSSGGISSYYSLPGWQAGINMTTNHGSTTQRNIPDVAMTADNVYVVSGGSGAGSGGVAGTSCAAPLWAGFAALANQQAVAGGKGVIGFINPAIYAIGKTNRYASDFNDITTGNNYSGDSTNLFPAVAGYDLCTGWGTPAGQNLINDLAGTADALAITSGRGFVASGPAAGPFTSSSQTFVLTNSGAASLTWSLISTSTWLTVSASGGTLVPGGSAASVTVGLNAAAYSLPVGTYLADVWFTNLTSHFGQDRQFILLVGRELVQNGGFETGTFSDWSQAGDNNSFSYDFADNGTTGIAPHSGAYLAALGESGAVAYLSQTLPTVAGQSYLLSLWLDSASATPPNDFLVQWNGTIIYNRTNMPAFAWTNLQFTVTATGPATVLQFGFRDDASYLGLDDVSVQPIPSPTFRTVSKSGNAVVLTWNSLAGITNQIQYSTNLTRTNWTSLSTNVAAGFTSAFTNSPVSDAQRFYRIRRLP